MASTHACLLSRRGPTAFVEALWRRTRRRRPRTEKGERPTRWMPRPFHSARYGWMLCLALAVAGVFPRASHAQTPQTAADSVTDRQSNDAFNSILDGQPSPPGHPEASITLAWEEEQGGQFQLGIELTPTGPRVLRNALFRVFVETVNVGEEANDTEHSIFLQWQQRWRAAGAGWPTIASAATVQVPLDAPDAPEVVLAGIVAADAGAGVAYLNIYSETVQGSSPGRAHGGVLGYKLPLTASLSAYGDVLLQRQAGETTVTAELSSELDFASGMTVGPGVSLAFTPGSEPVWGAGVFITYTF